MMFLSGSGTKKKKKIVAGSTQHPCNNRTAGTRKVWERSNVKLKKEKQNKKGMDSAF